MVNVTCDLPYIRPTFQQLDVRAGYKYNDMQLNEFDDPAEIILTLGVRDATVKGATNPVIAAKPFPRPSRDPANSGAISM